MMRDRVLRLHHLNRIQSPLINRVKQDLAWALPERAKTSVNGDSYRIRVKTCKIDL
jgi:hypothetical protein